MSGDASYNKIHCYLTDLCKSVQSFNMILEVKMKHLLHQCLAKRRLHLYFELINKFRPRCSKVPPKNLQAKPYKTVNHSLITLR